MDESTQTGPNRAQPGAGWQPGWTPPGQPQDQHGQPQDQQGQPQDQQGQPQQWQSPNQQWPQPGQLPNQQWLQPGQSAYGQGAYGQEAYDQPTYGQAWPPPGQQQPGRWAPQYNPDGTPAYYPPPMQQPAGRLAPVRTMGMVVQVLLVAAFVVGVVQLVAAFDQLNLLERIADNPGSVSQAEADRSDQFTQNVGVVWLLCYLLTGTFFMMWFYRIRTNAGIWAPAVQRRSRGWAIGGWICPVVNFWFPYQIAADALKSSRSSGSPDTTGGGLLGVWWGLWVCELVLALSVRGQRDADTLDGLTNAVRTDIAADVVVLAAAVAAVLVVRKLTALQEAKLAELATPGPGGMIAGWTT